MRGITLVILALVLLHTNMQGAESKQAKEVNVIHKVLHIYNILFKGLSGQHKRSVSLPDEPTGFGTCDEHDFAVFLSSYPPTCVHSLHAADPSGLMTGEPETFAAFANAFCDEKCGQPIVDLFNKCDLPEISKMLVYVCKVNADGDTCGALFPTVHDFGVSATNVCLPFNATCSTTCLQALDTLKGVGCCANFNQIGIDIHAEGEEDYNGLYELCGEDTIEPCTEGILRSGNTPVFTTAVWGLTALVLTVIILLL